MECLEQAISGHLCYIPHLSQPELSNNYIIYDFECTQETGIHIPNYIYVMGTAEGATWEFKCKGCLTDIITTFISPDFKEFTFLSHNAKGYDSYFILNQLVKEKMEVNHIVQGGKLMCVTVKKLKIRFIDSLNFLPMKLGKLPKALGFEGCKGYFPHFFLTLLKTGITEGLYPTQNFTGMTP